MTLTKGFDKKMKKYLTEFDELQAALKRVRIDETVMPYINGHLIYENADSYAKIQKILNSSEMSQAHRYLYDLDVENLQECEIDKVNQLFDLGVKKGYIDNSFEEEFDCEENPAAVIADEPEDQECCGKPDCCHKAPIACWTVLYSATKDGQIKTGECFSNAINVSAAKADCLAKLARFGYENVSVLAIEAGDPDMCGADNCCGISENDMLRNRPHNAHKDENLAESEDDVREDDMLKTRPHNGAACHNGHKRVNEVEDTETECDTIDEARRKVFPKDYRIKAIQRLEKINAPAKPGVYKFIADVDFLNLADTRWYDDNYSKFGTFEWKGRLQYKSNDSFVLLFDHEPTHAEIINKLNQKCRAKWGIVPYQEIEGECAVATIGVGEDDSMIVLANDEAEARDPIMHNELTQRWYPAENSADYIDFSNETPDGQLHIVDGKSGMSDNLSETGKNPYITGMKVVTGGKASPAKSAAKPKKLKEDDEADDSSDDDSSDDSDSEDSTDDSSDDSETDSNDSGDDSEDSSDEDSEDDTDDSSDDSDDSSDDSDDSSGDADSEDSADDTSDTDSDDSEDSGDEDSDDSDSENDSDEDSEDDSEDDSEEDDSEEDDSDEDDSDEDSEEDSEDEDKELTPEEKTQYKDEYKRAFKDTMLKCKFEGKSFNDLNIDQKVDFFTKLAARWKKADPKKFMTDKEQDQLEAITTEK